MVMSVTQFSKPVEDLPNKTIHEIRCQSNMVIKYNLFNIYYKFFRNKKLEMIDSSCPSMDSSSSSELDENLENSHSILDKDPYFTEPTLVAFRQKLWYYLFRNMNHAIDELYCMCELESSIEQGELADRVLKSCSLDFTKVVEIFYM